MSGCNSSFLTFTPWNYVIVGGVVAILVIVIVLLCGKGKKKNAAPVEEAAPEACEQVAPVEEIAEVKEEVAVAEEKKEEAQPVQERVEEVTQEKTEGAKPEGLVIGDIEDKDGDTAKRVPFKSKIMALDDNVKEYFNVIDNVFRSCRNINVRVSIKGVSYRLGRALVAKLTVRGKTLKLHLALDVDEFDGKSYFQKDMSDVKEYVEVPFTVKVRSDRALKKALELVDILIEKKEISKKSRYTAIDSIAALQEEE